MVRSETLGRYGRAALVVGMACLVALLLISGCSKQAATTTSSTAKGGVDVARSALSTTAPDAKLLLVQTAQTVTTTSTPVWAYLFGSPSKNKTFIVYVANGKSMGASEYGTVALTKAQWGKVPGVDAWKVDSDVAYKDAVAASGMKKPDAYEMGLVMYTPSGTTKPLTWYVGLKSGDTTAAIEVDAKSGKATKSK